MSWFRNMLRRNRIFILTLVAFNLYSMIEGHNFVYAREVRQQERERHLRAFSSTFGIPIEKLRRPREPFLDRLEPYLTQVEELIRDAWDSIELPWTYLAPPSPHKGPAGDVRPAAATPQEPTGPSSTPRKEIDLQRLQRLQSVVQDADKEQAGRAPLLEGASLPLRQVEKKARAENASSAVDSRAASSAVAPDSEPRRVIPKAAPAPEIVALARSLADSPGRIFRFVHDEIDFDPKWGADKSPLGTLQERRGSSWDQAWLLQQLLTAAGVDARLEWGEVEIPTPMLTNVTGVDDAFRAGDLLTTAGVSIVLFVQGSQVVGARMSHVWVKAHLDYIPNRGATPGPGDTWVRMDPSLKRFEAGGGVRLDEEVPFDLGEYLQSGTLLSPRAFYEDALAAYADANNLGVAGLEELKPPKSLIQEAFPFVPGTLRAKVLTVAGEATEVPAAFQQQLEVQVREAGGAVLLTWSTPWPAVYGRRVELAWPGATSADQSTLDLNGGVFATPPFEVDLRPVVRVDGTQVASGEEIGSAEDVELLATLTPPQGSPMVAFFELFAGEHAVFTVDFGRIPQETVDRYTAERDAATGADEEAWALALAGAVYLRSLSGDLEHLAALRYRRLVQIGNVVLAVRRGAVSRAADGTPLTFSAAPPSLDLGSMVLGLFPADGVAGPASSSVSTLELLGSQGSAREGESLTQALGGDHLTAVGFLTRAVREGQTLTRVDATNVEPALAAAELSSDAEASVRAGVDRGLIAWISQTQLPFDTWDTTGYVLEDPSTGAGGYFVTFERLVQGLEANIVFHSPQDLDVVTAPSDVIATIDVEGIESWTLSTRPVGAVGTTVIATGTGTVENTLLGQFDPTMLLNGMHDTVLTGRDAAGQTVSGKITVVVEGNMKIGHFRLSFTDFTIPLSGLDIELVRSYDTRQRFEPGAFGHGWSLDILQGSYRNNRPPGDGWQILSSGLPCRAALETKPHLTTVRLSEDEVYRFRLSLGLLAAQLGGCQARAGFTFVDGPEPGATLEILGNSDVFYQNGGERLLDLETFGPFEPRRVRLVTRDGRKIELDLAEGVRRLEDSNGNALTITDTGINHSSGTGVVFERDADGRITRIVDPAGHARVYSYDAAGDLVACEDPSGTVTTFTYDVAHFLQDLHDPLGRIPVRNEYDDAGRLIRTVDANGGIVNLDHDLGTRTEVITNRLGHTRILEYDGRGNTVRETDENGAVTLRAYDDDDNLLSETDALGRTTTYAYDANDDQILFTDPLGRETRFVYDGQGRVVSRTDPNGNVTARTFDLDGNLLSVEDGAGQISRNTYDLDGNLLSETDPLGQVTAFTYDARGNVLTQTDSEGGVITRSYDANGRLLSESKERTLADGSLETITRTRVYDANGRILESGLAGGPALRFTYDATGRMLSRTDASGQRTMLTYDPMGRLVAEVFADGTSESWVYDAEGRAIRRVDRAGRATELTYDAVGRLLTITFADGATETRAYDTAGNLTSLTDALGRATLYEYDAGGQQLREIDPLGNVTLATYDANGNRASSVDALGRTTHFTYDALDRLTEWSFADGTTVGLTYDAVGRRIATRDELGHVTTFGYDPIGRLTGVTDALGETTRYGFDEVGNQVAQTDALGRVTRFEYGKTGRPSRRILPDGSEELLTFAPGGNLQERTDFAGRTTILDYDSLNRLTRKTYPDGTFVAYTYTATGRRSSVTDFRGTTTYTYDARDRLATVTDPAGRKLTYTYDAVGNRTLLTATVGSENLTTSYGYDGRNRLLTVTDPQGEVYTATYDAVGNHTALSFPNGVETTSAYDLRNRLIERRTTRGVEVLDSHVYTLAANGRRLQVAEADGTRRIYVYDALQRLTGEQVEDAGGALVRERSYAYDAVGNRIAVVTDAGAGPDTIGASFDVRDRLTAMGATSFAWDLNGNLTDRDGTSGIAYRWDFESRLVAATLVDGSEIHLDYDADGNLVRTEVVPPDGPSTAVNYLVDPSGPLSQVILEVDDAGTILAHYTRGDRLLSVHRPPTGEQRFYHVDGLGSVRALTDPSGSVTDRYAYSAFGVLEARTGEDPNPYRFAGEAFDDNLALAYHRARWLDPSAGRFVSMDPFGGVVLDPMSLHRYLYGNADPINMMDPTGESGWTILLVILAAIAILLIADAAIKRSSKKGEEQARGAALLRELSEYAKSRDNAAIAGMRAIYERCIAEDVEYCGPICVQSDNITCQVGPPPAIRGPEQGKCFSPDCSEPGTYRVARYHCHGAGREGSWDEYFSPDDYFAAGMDETIYLVTPRGIMKKHKNYLGEVIIGSINE